MSASTRKHAVAALVFWAATALLLAIGEAAPARAQTPAIQIAGASATAPLALTVGCNVVVAETAAGTPVGSIASLVKPANALVSIWRYDNTAKVFRVGFFADSVAPVDFSVTGSRGQGQVAEAYYLCLQAPATVVPG